MTLDRASYLAKNHLDEIFDILPLTVTVTRTPPYVPDGFVYLPNDVYARFFENSIDIEILDKKLDGADIVGGTAGMIKTESPVYCGYKYGNGIIDRIKKIEEVWTVAVVHFWTHPLGIGSGHPTQNDNVPQAVAHEIAFPTTAFNFYVPSGVRADMRME